MAQKANTAATAAKYDDKEWQWIYYTLPLMNQARERGQ
jgi:hypothetical protein